MGSGVYGQVTRGFEEVKNRDATEFGSSLPQFPETVLSFPL